MSNKIEKNEEQTTIEDRNSSITKTNKILLIGNDIDNNLTFKCILNSNDYQVDDFMYKDVSKDNFNINEYSLLILDLGIDPKSIFDIYEKIKNKDQNINLLLITEFNLNQNESYEKFYLNQKATKINIIKKPVDNEDFLNIVNNIIKDNNIIQNQSEVNQSLTDKDNNIETDIDLCLEKVNNFFEWSTSAFSNIGGLSKEIEKIKEMISVTFNLSSKLKEIGLESSNGILLYGPPGTGKTSSIKSMS